ncbi:MAG: GAF domain-containing protein [Anaerolineae bacterium]|nr:GAF domain-containing protein [Anaerolineae bacterium]
MAVFAILASAANVALYVVTGAWQHVGGVVIVAVMLVVAWYVKQLVDWGRNRAAEAWTVAAPLILIALTSLLWQGVALALALMAFGVGVLFAVLMLRPERRAPAVLVSAAVGITIWLTGSVSFPWDRFDAGGHAINDTILRILSIGALGVLVWRLVVGYRRLIAIRSRLVVTFIAVVIAVALAVSLTSILLGVSTTQQRTLDQLYTAVVLKSRAVDTWLDDLRFALESLVVDEYEHERVQAVLLRNQSDEYRASAAQELRIRFSTLIERTRWFTEILLIDSNGEVVLSTNPNNEGRNVASSAYFQEGLQDFYVNPPRYDPLVDGITIIVAQPLRTVNVPDAVGETAPSDETTYGVMAARTDMGQLNVIASTGQIGDSGTTDFVSTDYLLLTGRSVAGGYIPVQSEAIESALNRVMGIRRGIYSSHRGVRVSGAYMWLPRLQVALLMEQAQSEVLSAAITTSLANAGVALLAVVVAVTIAIAFANSIGQPLSDLAATATQVAGGDLDLVAEVVRDDEVGAVARAFNAMTAQLRDLIVGLEERVEERTRGLQAVAEVSRATTSVLDLDRLLPQVVNLAQQRFGLYYVGLFLTDDAGIHHRSAGIHHQDREYAVLRAGTGAAGREMLAQGWALAVGGQSMIGQCVATGKAVIKQQAGDEVVRFENPWLPDTRSELALPLRYGGNVIGAMTVQSTESRAFDETAIAVLQNLADQVAVAVQNARLFAETQAALDRVRRAQRRYERQAWSEYLKSLPHARTSGSVHAPGAVGATAGTVVYEQPGGTVERQAPDTRILSEIQAPEVQAALASGQPVSIDHQILVPIMQSGQIVGTVGVLRDTAWSQEDVTLVQNLVEQLALAAENQRLLDVTQRREAAERLTREVTMRMREPVELEDVLRTASEEIRAALNCDWVVVRMAGGHATEEDEHVA